MTSPDLPVSGYIPAPFGAITIWRDDKLPPRTLIASPDLYESIMAAFPKLGPVTVRYVDAAGNETTYSPGPTEETP